MNHFESWTQFVDVEKSEHNPLKMPTLRLIVACQVANHASRPDRAMSDALMFDPCSGRGQIHFFLKKFGCVSLRKNLSVKVMEWSIGSGNASPSATQISLIHFNPNDPQDR